MRGGNLSPEQAPLVTAPPGRDDVHTAARAAGLELSGGGVVRPVPIPADAYTVSAGTFRSVAARGDGAASMLLGGVEGDDAAEGNVSAPKSLRDGFAPATPGQVAAATDASSMAGSTALHRNSATLMSLMKRASRISRNRCQASSEH